MAITFQLLHLKNCFFWREKFWRPDKGVSCTEHGAINVSETAPLNKMSRGTEYHPVINTILYSRKSCSWISFKGNELNMFRVFAPAGCLNAICHWGLKWRFLRLSPFNKEQSYQIYQRKRFYWRRRFWWIILHNASRELILMMWQWTRRMGIIFTVRCILLNMFITPNNPVQQHLQIPSICPSTNPLISVSSRPCAPPPMGL